MSTSAIDPTTVRQDTQRWLERAVIGLNLCPFARAVQARGLIHLAVAAASTEEDLLVELEAELLALRDTDPAVRETTLLVVPNCLEDFLVFNDFLGLADILLRQWRLPGQIQIASFHPQYQFAGTDPHEVANATNRSPYPTLHLLREDSISRAVAAVPDVDAIVARNIRTLEGLGAAGWAALQVGPSS
ncbi:MAG: DUF1415 domain-containing protein [Rhodoferax sp.]|nr:DUF1415 domain-containing protein [Rhodoferax sp.]